jgi:arabinofuranosyltransferase
LLRSCSAIIGDDAFIAFRYAANLVHGKGLVFNAGQRVEGISDLGWTMLMTIPEFCHVRPELFAIVIGTLSSAAAIVIARRTLTNQLKVSFLTAFSISVLAAFNCDFWIMAGNGIESGLYALILTLALSALLQMRVLLTGGLLGVAITLRPEGLALLPLAVICLGVASFLQSRNVQESLQCLWKLRWPIFTWLAVAGGILIWRHYYYGEWVPNTITDKAHPLHASDFVEGLSYVVRFSGRSAPWVAVGVAIAFFRPPVALVIALVWLVFQTFVILPNAGDWMPGYRLLTVFIPIPTVMSGFVFDRLFTRNRIRIWGIAFLLAICSLVQVSDKRWISHPRIIHKHETVDLFDDGRTMANIQGSFTQVASAIRAALRPEDVVSPEVLGLFSYELLNVTMHDYLGLADSYIAHHGNISLPMFGKLLPVYSVETVAPVLFVFLRGDATIGLFERETAGRFTELYDCWLVTNRAGRIIIALRKDRERDFLARISTSALKIERIQPSR